jgi:hypothetical protein
MHFSIFVLALVLASSMIVSLRDVRGELPAQGNLPGVVVRMAFGSLGLTVQVCVVVNATFVTVRRIQIHEHSL